MIGHEAPTDAAPIGICENCFEGTSVALEQCARIPGNRRSCGIRLSRSWRLVC